MRGRGLKLASMHGQLGIFLSPPMRGRGIETPTPPEKKQPYQVAPHAGAWIETSIISGWIYSKSRRPPCGGVD